MRRGWRPSRTCNPISTTTRRIHITRTPQPSPPELATLLQAYSKLPPRQVPLSTLLAYGSPLNADSVLSSAAYVREEIPRRLARGVRNLDALPFIVGTNPFITRIHKLYTTSFQELASFPEIQSVEENLRFARRLEGHVNMHANDIPTMAKGFAECARYMDSATISAFLDAAITSRIGVRLIAEQHIALSRTLSSSSRRGGHIGVVDLACSPKQMIDMCASFVSSLCDATLGAAPPLVIDGIVDARFAYVPVHIEYMLTEILKNSYRATVENHFSQYGQSSSTPIPPVVVTISPSDDTLSLRVRDQGGGVSPANVSRVFSYAFTTAGRGSDDDGDDDGGGGPYAAQHIGGSAAVGGDSDGAGDGNVFSEIAGKGLQTGMGTIAGLGYGLPLARLYANYFGGSLDLISLHGHGTDVFMKLRRLDQGGGIVI